MLAGSGVAAQVFSRSKSIILTLPRRLMAIEVADGISAVGTFRAFGFPETIEKWECHVCA